MLRPSCLAVVLTLSTFTNATYHHTGSIPDSLLSRDLDPSATTDPSQFYRRAWHGSVLLGDTLYIDGGEFTYGFSGNVSQYPYNSTYALDLSTSWSPETATFHKIDKGSSPILNTPNLWPSTDNKSFYLFNGDITLAGQHRADPPKVPELWQFTPNGITQGSWRRTGFASSLIGVTRAKSTYGEGSVHILGGFAFDRSSGAVADIEAKPGLVSYDMSTDQWQNRSMTPYIPVGSAIDGSLHFVNNLGGANGLVIAFGGVVLLSSQQFVDFETVGLFNPANGQWTMQKTTGEIPPSRRLACSAGVAGKDGTYEIFVHGGSAFTNENETTAAPPVTVALDQVWILSLPSFSWYKTSTYKAADPRWAHTCHIPGNPPRSQLVSIGGFTPDQNRSYESRDPRPQGIGIFDLSTLTWVNSYNANAPSYTTPKIVLDGLKANGSYPSVWNDANTPVLLTGKTSQELLAQPKSSQPGLNDSAQSKPSTESGTLSIGAIIGIAVGGFVAFLGIYILAACFCGWPVPFRKRRSRQDPRRSIVAWNKAELASEDANHRPFLPEKDHTVFGTQEISGQSVTRYEMQGSVPEPYEMSGGTVRPELPAHSKRYTKQ